LRSSRTYWESKEAIITPRSKDDDPPFQGVTLTKAKEEHEEEEEVLK
jgi:hypothetical protein